MPLFYEEEKLYCDDKDNNCMSNKNNTMATKLQHDIGAEALCILWFIKLFKPILARLHKCGKE